MKTKSFRQTKTLMEIAQLRINARRYAPNNVDSQLEHFTGAIEILVLDLVKEIERLEVHGGR